MTNIPPPMTILMLVIFTVMVGIASTYPPGARFMTFVVGIPAIALCLLQLAVDLYRRRTAQVEDTRSALQQAEDQVARIAGRRVQFELPSENAIYTDTTRDPRETLRREIVVWGYFLALIAAILLFGFRITVPIFLVAFLRFQAGANWRNSLLLGGLGALTMYVLFEKVLRITLHTGFLTDIVTDLLGF
jgi:hypothetical protein